MRYRDVVEMLAEGGLEVDYTKIDRWFQQYIHNSMSAAVTISAPTKTHGNFLKPIRCEGRTSVVEILKYEANDQEGIRRAMRFVKDRSLALKKRSRTV